MVKIKECQWFGFSQELVRKKFEGDPIFIREFSIAGDTWAVFKVLKPNRKKQHKDFMLLRKNPMGDGTVAGLDKKDMRHYQYQSAMHCLACNQIVYSINRHHLHSCGCPNDTWADGGKDYMRFSARNMKRARRVTINLITGRIVKHRPSQY